MNFAAIYVVLLCKLNLMKNRVPIFIIILILIAWNISMQISLHHAEDNIGHIKSSIEAATDELQLQKDNHKRLLTRVQHDEEDIDKRMEAMHAGGWMERTPIQEHGLFQ